MWIQCALCGQSYSLNAFVFVFPSDTLELTGNYLTGPIPASIGQLTNLKRKLSLSWNLLSGSIPASIGNLVGLVELWMYQNRVRLTKRCYRYQDEPECKYIYTHTYIYLASLTHSLCHSFSSPDRFLMKSPN